MLRVDFMRCENPLLGFSCRFLADKVKGGRRRHGHRGCKLRLPVGFVLGQDVDLRKGAPEYDVFFFGGCALDFKDSVEGIVVGVVGQVSLVFVRETGLVAVCEAVIVLALLHGEENHLVGCALDQGQGDRTGGFIHVSDFLCGKFAAGVESGDVEFVHGLAVVEDGRSHGFGYRAEGHVEGHALGRAAARPVGAKGLHGAGCQHACRGQRQEGA